MEKVFSIFQVLDNLNLLRVCDSGILKEQRGGISTIFIVINHFNTLKMR